MSNWWDQYPYAAPRLPQPWEPNAPTGLAALHAPRDTEYAPYQPQPVGLAALSPSASPSAMNPPGPGSLDALRQATAHIPPVRLPDPPAAQKPPAEQPGLLSDVGNLLKSGYANTAQGLNWLAGKVPGLNQVIDAEGGQQYWGDVANQAHANLSQAQQVAGQKKFFNDDNSLGPSWSDPRAYLGIAVESIPGTVIGMGMGGPITGALQKAGLAALPRLGAVGAERLAMGAGALGYGAGEGLTAAGSNAVQAKETVLQMPHEELQKVSPQYRELLQSLSPDQARAKLAEDTANQVGLQTGLTVAATGAPMGAAFGKLFHGSGQLGKTLLGSLGVGVAGEAGQELVQSGAEQFLQNKAIQENVNPQQSLWQGVLNQAVSGALAGGIMGGAMAAGGHGSTTANTQRNAEQAADNAIKQADQARDHLLNADDQVLAHSLATLNALPQDQLSADHQARVGDVTNAIQSEIERRIQRGAPTETGHPGLEGSFDPSIGLSNAPQATDAPATDLQQLDDLQRLHGSQSQSAQPAALQDSPVSQDLASSPPEAARAVQRNALASEVQQLNQPQSPSLPSPTAMESQQAPLSGTKQKQGIAAEAGALNQAPTKPSDSIQLQRGQSIELSPLLGQASTKPSVSAQEQARLAEKMGARPQQKTSPASEVAPVSRTQTSTNPLAPMPAASAPKPQPEIQNDQRHQEGQAQTAPLLNQQHALSNLRTEEVPVDRLRLSEEVPQFKSGANEKTGVVEPLGGKYDRTGTAPIIVWQRTDGQQEVISGRHRLDLARRSGEKTIPAQILSEADGFGPQQAAILDAELNIRDGQGKVKDYVNYFKHAGIDQQEADLRGLISRPIGQRAFAIANEGTKSLIAAHRADQLSDDAAYRISSAAPGNERLQAVGIKAIAEGKSTSNAVNFMQAVGSLAAERGATADTTGDLFGFDDSALKEAERMATLASRQQRRLTERLAAIQGAAKRPDLARQEGINVNDPAALRAKIAEIKQQRDAWENWSTTPNLVAQIREEMTAPTKPARVTPADTVVKAPLLSSYSQADLQAEQTRLKQLEAEQATGSNRPSDIAMAAEQEGLGFSQPAQQPTDQEKLDHLLSSDPVVVPIRPALTDKHGKSLRDAADLLYRELQPATNQVDGKTVRFVRKAFKEMRQHSADERVMHIVPSLRTLFEKATPLWIDEDDGTHGRVKAWHNYGVRAAIDGKDTIVRLVARELDDGTLELLHYDADVRDPTEIENAMTGFAERSQQPKPGGQQNISSRKDRLIQWLENSYQGQPKLSRADSPTANTLTPTQARAQLVEALGEKAVKALQQAGRLEIHQNDPTKTGAAGFVDRNGVIHLVASNLENGDALSVALHEAMHIAVDDRFHEGNRAHIRLAHAALKLFGLKNFIGNPSFTTLVQDAYRLAAQGDKTAQQALAKAQQEYEANHHTDVQQELVSYLVQYADEKLPLVRRILSAIRAALFRMGIKVKLTPSDIRALAVSALKSQAKAAGKAVARQERRAATAFSQSDNPAPLTPQQRFEWAAAGVKLLTGNSDAFQYQTSTKQDLTAIAKDLSVKHKLRVTEEPAQGKERVWVVTMPDGKHASITLAANGREVHINAVLLEQGFSHGGLLYQLVGQWAHNTGKVFIGDPLGITDAGKARRLEHLISLALKFNSTDFIQPHPYQNIPWRIGQHDYNLAQMLMRSSELLHNTIPDLKALRYDFGKRQFVNTDTGRTLGQADFAALAQSPGARAAQAGATTLKRNVLVHTLVQSAGRAGWRSILGELAQQGSAQRRLDPAIRRLFSHATTADAAAEQDRLWQEFQAIRAQFQAKQASTTAFARWFGDGFEGITAKDGKPLTLYHGTPTEFYQFDADRAGHNSKHPTSGLGFFMTADKGAAYRYGGNVLELHARINNPYFLTDADLMAVDSVAQAAKLKRQLQDKGYDGAAVTGPGMSPYVIAFQSHQVKLTSNQNPTESADFRYSMSSDAERARHRSFLEGEPVAVLTGNEFSKDGVPLTVKVPQWYAQHGDSLVNAPGIGEVMLDVRAVKDSIARGLGKNKAAAFAAVPDVLRKGRVLHKAALEGSRGQGAVYFVGAPVSLGEQNMVEVVVVKSTPGHHRMYVHEVALLEPLQAAFKTGADASFDGALAGAEPGAIRSLLQSIFSDNPIIRYSRPGRPAANQSAAPPAETQGQAILRRTQDKFNRFDVVQKWLKANGVDLSPAADVYGAEALLPKKTAAATESAREKILKPLVTRAAKNHWAIGGGQLIDAMAEARPLPASFKPSISEYLHAAHAKERNTAIAKANPKFPDGGSGLTNAQADAILSRYRGLPGFALFETLAKEFQAITHQTRDTLLQAGILSPEMVKAWDSAYQQYVPLKGGPADASQRTGTGGGISVSGKQKRALGHTLRDENIIENIWRDHERALYLAQKQEVARALKEMLAHAKNDQIGTVGQPEKRAVLHQGWYHQVWIEGAPLGAFQSYNDAKAAIAQDSQRTGRAVEKYGIRHQAADPSVIYTGKPMLEDHEVALYENGQLVRLQLNDDLLARAARNLGVDAANGLLRAGQSFNRWLSAAYTGYNPEFILTNVARDLIAGSINLTGQHGIKTAGAALRAYPKAVAALWRYLKTGSDPLIERYRKAGGSTGAAYLSDLERIGTDIKTVFQDMQGARETWASGDKAGAARVAVADKVRWVGGWIEKLNQVGENALRVATFQTLLQQGHSEADAARAAGGVTVNFNRKGELTTQLGSLYLFFNPSIQGTKAIWDALATGAHRHQAQALAGGLTLLALTLAQLARGGDEDDEKRWRTLPGYTKDRNMIFPVGKGAYLTLPVPYGYGAFWSLGNILSDLMHGEDATKAGIRLASTVFEQFSPVGNPFAGDEMDSRNIVSMLPTALKPAVSLAMNRSELGRPIMPDVQPWNPNKPDSQRMWRSTQGSIWERMTGNLNQWTGGDKYRSGAVDVSPETLKMLWRTLTGGAGQFATDTISAALVVGQGGASDVTAREIPILRRFVRAESIQDARALFYEQAREIEKATALFRAAKSDRNQAAMGTIAKENQALLSLGRILNGAQKAIKARRQVEDAITRSDLPLAAKRRQLAAIEQEEDRIYSKFHRLFTGAHEKTPKRAVAMQ